MAPKDANTNIMLDLECTSVEHPNPILLELAAIHFDIDTGVILNSISTPISYQSCVDAGLQTDERTLIWVAANIPATLEASKNSKVSLEQALFRFNQFIRRSVQTTYEKLERDNRSNESSQPMIWGNGAVADNVWIQSAYKACGMTKPWKFYNDMCVRTFVKQLAAVLGRDFTRDPQIGIKHIALDDCKHQVAYLVKTRNLLLQRIGGRREPAADRAEIRDVTLTQFVRDRPQLQTPETSFLGFEPILDDSDEEGDTDTDEFMAAPQEKQTPETSFTGFESILDDDDDEEGDTDTDEFMVEPRQTQTPGGKNTIASLSLPTPDTSFCALAPVQNELINTDPIPYFNPPAGEDSPTGPSVKRLGLLSPSTSFTFTSLIPGQIGEIMRNSSERPSKQTTTRGSPAKLATGLPTPDTSFSEAIPSQESEDAFVTGMRPLKWRRSAGTGGRELIEGDEVLRSDF